MRKITKAGVLTRVANARQKLGRRIAAAPAETKNDHLAASFAKYLERREGRTFVGFPSRWRVDHPAFDAPAPIAVVMHVYFTDLMPELIRELKAIPVPFDLFVTNASGTNVTLEGLEETACRNHRLVDVENRGRDIWPMVQLVNAGWLDDYDLIFKIHTKKSEWRESHELEGTGEEWKQGFYRDLLGSPENVSDIISGILENPHIGTVTSNGSICGPEHWGGDLEITGELLRRLVVPQDPNALRFPSGSIYWIRGFILQGLRALQLDAPDFEDEAGQIDGTTAHAVERLIGILAAEAGFETVERSEITADVALDSNALTQRLANPQPIARAVAYYLPQYHPFTENNAWWGEGFTEWTNVAKARPMFLGHNQPLLPSDLGFYDLRLDEVRERQTELANGVGIGAFMYYYYWFSGTKLMDMPIERLHQSDLDQPFCIMWANENWTRRWDGASKHVLIAQEYEKVPAEQFIEDVMHLLKDRRYVRVDGGALLAVYRIAQMPDYPKVLEHWRKRAREEGVGELHIVAVDVGASFDGLQSSYEAAGVQGFIAFPPHNHKYYPANRHGLEVSLDLHGNIFDYHEMVRDAERRHINDFPDNDYPGAMVNFDNTARRQYEPDLWHGSNPYTFRRWLRSAANAVADRDPDHRIVIINAWNEWAEGAVLEPSHRFGRSYLRAVRSALH